MQPFCFFFVGYLLWGGISGSVRALNLTVPLGSGRVGSDDLGYGPGSGFSFEPVQTSSPESGGRAERHRIHVLEVQCEVSSVSDDLDRHVICWCWSTVCSEVHCQQEIIEHASFC